MKREDPACPAPPPTRLRAQWLGVCGVAVVALFLIIHRVSQAVRLGPEWDAYAFLANAATFAGKGFGYSEPHRPPFMSFLTSIWFRFAPLSEAPIQWIDGALTLSGVVAVYLLLQRRVSRLLSAAGAIGFLGVTPVWEWLGMGYTDAPSVALSFWALLAAIWATERDPRWYLALGPLFMLASLTRYTALIAGFPIAVWLLLRWFPFRHAGRIAGAVLAAIATYLPAAVYYTARMGDALFPFLFAFTLSEVVSNPAGEGAVRSDALYYVRNLPDLMGYPGLSWLALLLTAAGVYALAFSVVSSVVMRPQFKVGAVLISVAGAAVALGTQIGGGLVVRQVAIPMAIVITWRALSPRQNDADGPGARVTSGAALDAAMLAWLLAYFDFHGHQIVQLPRYFIPMAIPVLYFVLLGWSKLAEYASEFIGSASSTSVLQRPMVRHTMESVAVASLLIMMVSTALSAPPEPNITARTARESAAWLRENTSSDEALISDIWPYTSWYLGRMVPPMPLFEVQPAFEHELEKRSAATYVTERPSRTYENYTLVNSTDDVHVMRRVDNPPAALPRIVYLGTAWDNYVEGLVNYSLYLESTAGRYGLEGTSFLDAHTVDELTGYDTVAVAAFRWRDRAAGENTIREYVESGGSLVIDASQNLGGLAYSVADTIMFDTLIRRATLPAEATIVLTPEFAAKHPALGAIDASPWIDEGGGPWSGALYEARPGTPPLEVLATAGGHPLVQLQRLGEGRIYWISFNLVWHAFTTENDDEARLIEAVFAEALAKVPSIP